MRSLTIWLAVCIATAAAAPRVAARVGDAPPPEVVFIDMTDLDQVRLEIDGSPVTARLSNVLPFHRWPTKLDDPEKKLRDDALATLRHWLRGAQTAKRLGILVLKGETAAGGQPVIEMQVAGHGPAGESWPGTFKQHAMWNYFHVSMYLVEAGLSPLVDEDFERERKSVIDRGHRQAETAARSAKRGFWADDALARELTNSASILDNDVREAVLSTWHQVQRIDHPLLELAGSEPAVGLS